MESLINNTALDRGGGGQQILKVLELDPKGFRVGCQNKKGKNHANQSHVIRTYSKKGGSGNSIIQKTKKNNLKKRGKGKNSKRKTKKSKNNLKKKKGKNIKRRKKMSNKNLEKNKGKINKQKAKKSKVKKNKKSNLKKQGRKNKKKTSKNSKGARNGGDKKTSRQTSCTNDCVIVSIKKRSIYILHKFLHSRGWLNQGEYLETKQETFSDRLVEHW